MSKYQVREFDATRLAQVKHAWKGLAGDDEFALELAGLFVWSEAHIAPQSGDSRAWELYNKDNARCDAIVELVDGHDGKLTKLLKLFLSPEFWDIDAHYDRVASIYIDTFIAVIQQGLISGTRDVKLYGRSPMMLSILRSIHAAWPEREVGAKAAFHGRWLTITLDS